MLVSALGEFGLIERIAQGIGCDPDKVVMGIGDDVAVLKFSDERYLLATCDIQVAGVHFLPEAIEPYQLGRKAVAINLSDIASMGGIPEHLLVSLVLTPETSVEFVDGLYQGIRQECEAARVNIVGGNMATSPTQMMVDIFLTGWVEPEQLLLRSGAKAGDLLLVTGQVGASAAGLALLQAGGGAPQAEEKLRTAHLTPQARLREGRAISTGRWATAMIDISDGLASDLGHLCSRSQVGAEIWEEKLPIGTPTRELAERLDKDALDWALFGGEDYELLFTAPEDKAEALAERVSRETGTPVSIIGRIMPLAEGMRLVKADGGSSALRPGGWDHFRQGDLRR